MIALIRLWILLLIGLPILYLLVRTFARSLEREKLEKRWDAKQGPGTRDEFVARGMAVYSRSLRKKLLWGVIIVPLVGITTLVYVLNFT